MLIRLTVTLWTLYYPGDESKVLSKFRRQHPAPVVKMPDLQTIESEKLKLLAEKQKFINYLMFGFFPEIFCFFLKSRQITVMTK